jgi:hypothetical protein
MLRKFSAYVAVCGRRAPKGVGILPLLTMLGVTSALVAACAAGSSDQVTPPVDLGMVSTMAPYYQDENVTIYEAQTPVQLPIRQPTSADYKAMGPAPKGTPYPHGPFMTVGDETIEVHYTISNIDPQSHAVWLLIDPWNEFVRWDPGVTIVSDEETEPNWGYDLVFLVPGDSRVEGTLTTDDMQEIATKLASVENMLASPEAMQADEAADAAAGDNGPDDPNATSSADSSFDPVATANNIFNPQNRSNSGDVLYTPWIPPVIAGLTGFDLGLRTYEQANIAIEITMEIQDVNGDRFITIGSNAPQLGPPPKVLSPPGAIF